MFSWSLTQYSKFNRTDNLLLVCGVFIPDNIHEYPDVSLGRGAIFTVPGKSFLAYPQICQPQIFISLFLKYIFLCQSFIVFKRPSVNYFQFLSNQKKGNNAHVTCLTFDTLLV